MNLFTNTSGSNQPKSGNALVILFIIFAFLIMVSFKSQAGEKIIPGMPGPVTGQVNVCALVGTGQESAYSIDPVEGAEVYLWTVPPTVTITGGQGSTNITVTFSAGFTSAANKQLRVRAISQDGYSADRIFYMVSQLPSTPSAIAGPSNACLYIGTNNPATYTTSRDAAASGYLWGTNPSTTEVVHPNGSGVNDTIIQVIFKTGYKTSPITVQSLNNCGVSASRTLNVSGVAPSMPGLISGPTNACAYMLPNGDVATYSITAVAGALSYTWLTPPGAIVGHPNGSGPTDVTITVQYPDDFVSGSIKVIAASGCDESAPRSLNITRLNPATPGIITAVQRIVCPNREYSYTLPAMPSNSNSILWKVPVDAISFSGQGTTSINVLYPEDPVSGIVTAAAISNCASSSVRQSVVRLGRCQLERTINTASRSGKGITKENPSEKNLTQQLEVNVAPNPSKNDFKIQVTSGNREIINIKVLDLQGRELKKTGVLNGQVISFGNELKPGTYILEVNQGNVKHTEKLLKL